MLRCIDMRLLVLNIQFLMCFIQIFLSVGQNSVNFLKNNGHNGFLRHRSKLSPPPKKCLFSISRPTLKNPADPTKLFSYLKKKSYFGKFWQKVNFFCPILVIRRNRYFRLAPKWRPAEAGDWQIYLRESALFNGERSFPTFIFYWNRGMLGIWHAFERSAKLL